MAGMLRGPHHSVGIAVSVAERIFHFMKVRADANGGKLAAADLGGLHAQFLASLPKAAHFFEEMDRQYAEACGGTAQEYFSHDSILITLLSGCLRKAALKAFPQVELIGGNWLNQFLGGVARYIRVHACADADDRLTKAYFEAAARLGPKLQVADLLGDEATRRVLKECFAPFVAREAVERIAESFCDTVTSTSPPSAASARPIPPKSLRVRSRNS